MSFEHSIQRLMSGQAKGLFPSLGRSALACIEPLYRFEVNRRNRRFDRDASRARKLPKPVISVGNLTTGGTGKTPVIRWLAGALRDRGLNVGILARGYKAEPGTLGDEQRMLLAMLGGGTTTAGRVVIECDPDRHAAGLRALEREPAIDLFLLDDGFQHRRLHRDLDIVLLHAPEPFGYGHVLPRGLLREPITGLKRAGIVILTSADAATPESRATTIAEIRQHNAGVQVVFERHEPTGLRSAGTPSDQPADVPLSALREKSAMCFSGLGSPGGFERQIRSLAGKYAGEHRFPDHHAYTADDVRMLQASGESAGAEVLVTTEKDWVKLAAIDGVADAKIPIWRLDVEARFEGDGAGILLAAAMARAGRGCT
ncbi:tetraacyldisaccharide 4'-kinase [Humisphaera borealis]|uniref:Tetraacyldisaccharide 4'-kinase n=1 Tax=Humisphaera borealis TaxID=2807512 RepID=A0A7M2X490_9BACT|nr:tetraacyldisaccharide 4'-kinase [Humisphaera borealis]QOV92262.1 tetraacyldisaccharide 4'-kinase [Humisphaera borealis]